MTQARYGLYDLLLYLYPIIFLSAQWQIMEGGRFVYLLSFGFLSAVLVHKQRLTRNPVVLGLSLVACYSIATSLLSHYPLISLLKGMSLLLLVGFLLFVPPAIERLHPAMGAKEYILRMFLYLGIVIVISNGIYYFINPSSSNEYLSGTSLLEGRFRGYFVNPNDLAALYGIFFIPILWYAIGKHQRLRVKLGLVATLLVAAIELVATQSRSGILAVLAALSILILGQKKWASRVMIVCTTALILVGAYIEDPENNFVRSFVYRNEIELEGSGRFPVWIRTWNKFLENPMLGGGLGVTETDSGKEEALAFASEGYTIEKGNSYLGALEELGMVGIAILFGSLFVPIFRASWNGLNTINLPNAKPNLILIAVIAGGLINATFEAWLLSVGNFATFSFWIFAFLLVNEGRSLEYGITRPNNVCSVAR